MEKFKKSTTNPPFNSVSHRRRSYTDVFILMSLVELHDLLCLNKRPNFHVADNLFQYKDISVMYRDCFILGNLVKLQISILPLQDWFYFSHKILTEVLNPFATSLCVYLWHKKKCILMRNTGIRRISTKSTYLSFESSAHGGTTWRKKKMKWVKCPPVLHQFWQYRGLGSTALLQKTDKQITLTTENKGERMNKSPSLISSIATSFWHWLIVFLFSLSLEKSKKAFYLLQPRRKLGDYRKYNTHIVDGYTTSDQLDFLLLKWTDKRPAAKNSRKKIPLSF